MNDYTDFGRTIKLAIMFPSDIELTNCTHSERMFYEALKKQLPDRVLVFYSVPWYTTVDGERKNSESDFLIFDPDFGYLTIEVKGGRTITKDGDKWILQLDAENERILTKSPFKQAEDSMYFYRNYYYEQYNQRYNGVYGFAVAFPNFNITSDFGPDAPKELTIDYNDMDSLGERINQLFHYWKGKQRIRGFLVPDKIEKFINMINKSINLSIISGAMIEEQERKSKILNRIQDNYIEFINNYNKAFIVGGAGTGKTWIALKKAKQVAFNENLQVLIVCYNSLLAVFLREQTKNETNITCMTFWQLAAKYIERDKFDRLANSNDLIGVFDELDNIDNLMKYDCIIVDEAQDFNEEWALSTRLFLKDEDESQLYVFYDSEQNIFERDFKNGFLIENPPFKLRENLRNTSSILKWIQKETDYGKNMKVNTISGIQPEKSSYRKKSDARNSLEALLKQLIFKESVPSPSVVILSNRTLGNSILNGKTQIGPFNIIEERTNNQDIETSVLYRTIQGFKGLESDVVIYLQHTKDDVISDNKLNYVAYTRAKYLLYVIEYKE